MSAPSHTESRQLQRQADAEYAAARAGYRGLSDPEFAGIANGLAHEAASCGDLDDDSRAVCRILVEPRLRAARGEIDARARRHRAGAGPDPDSRWSSEWRALADEVKRCTDLAEVFEANGYPLIRRGREHAGPCLACGGTDRMVVVPADHRAPWPRYFCRQCHDSGDAITCLRTLRPGLGFYDAIAELALPLGLSLPVAPWRRGEARR